MVTNRRTLTAMTKQGFIKWEHQIERHWTGAPIRRCWVQPGPKLAHDFVTFRYRGHDYRLHYVSGCFHPFVFRVGSPRPTFI